MTWNDDARRLAVAAIGKVESRLNYSSINYNDPITVGIAQWYGVRAADILAKIRDANPQQWSDVASTLKSDLSNNPTTSAYWNTRYLTRAEGNSLIPLLKAASDIQDNQLAKDIDGYSETAKSHGLNADTNTETFILFAVAYHQGPRYALHCLSLVGGQASVEMFLNACLNHAILGQYRNRYNEAYRIIKNKDTSGVGSVGNSSSVTTTPGGSAPPSIISGTIYSISLEGDGTLAVQTGNGTIIAYPTSVNYWVIGERDGGTVGATQSQSPSVSGGDEKRLKVVQWMKDRIDKIAYSQGPNRLNPDQSGYGDCSSTIWRAYKDIVDIDIGTWTGTQKDRGTEIARGSGKMSQEIVSKLKPADVIVMGWGWSDSEQHVEMSLGGLGHIGHGGPDDGPDIGENISTYLSDAVWWTVRRHISE